MNWLFFAPLPLMTASGDLQFFFAHQPEGKQKKKREKGNPRKDF